MKKNKIMLFLFLIAFFVIIFALGCYAEPNKGFYDIILRTLFFGYNRNKIDRGFG